MSSITKPPAAPPPAPPRRPDIEHHLKEWTSGTRGGGKLPADFGWSTNPKQWQEENGANLPKGAVREAVEPKLP